MSAHFVFVVSVFSLTNLLKCQVLTCSMCTMSFVCHLFMTDVHLKNE